MAITISDTEPRVQYTASSGQTAFSVPFEFFTTSDIKVYNGTSLLTYNASPSSASQYSVTGAGVSGGGSITLGGGATVNDVITIYRDLAIARSTDFPTSGAFQIASLNDELDKIVAMCQQLERDLKFSPRAAATTANTFNITFPNLAANKVLSVNSSGNGLEFSQDITDITTIAGIASDVTTVSGIASNVTTVAGAVSNINTTVSNLASINNFAEVYRIASGAPTSSLHEGDLWYDSANNVLKYYNGTIWTVTAAAGLSNVVEDTTPELGGHLDCNDKNLTEVGTVSGTNLQIDFGTLS